MRSGRFNKQARVWRGAMATLGSAWRRRHLGRPVAAGFVLVAVAGGLTMASALLDRRDVATIGDARGWPTAVAGRPAAATFGPTLSWPERGAGSSDDELAATLAHLKAGAFGVDFEGLPGEARATPVVLVDAATPPLRLDIMGLGIARLGAAPAERGGAAATGTAP